MEVLSSLLTALDSSALVMLWEDMGPGAARQHALAVS